MMEIKGSRGVTALASLECGIGLVGILYFVLKGLIRSGLSNEMRVIIIATGFFYTVLVFSGFKMLYLKSIGRKLTLFLSPFYALLVVRLLYEIFVIDNLFGNKFANLSEASGGVVFMSIFLLVLLWA